MAEPFRRVERELWPLWLSLLVLVPVGLIILLERYDGLYGQDPFAYFDYATGPVRESLLRLRPLPPFYWPPGYPIVVALVSLVLGTSPLAGQLVSLIAGASVPVFTALLAHEIWPERGARVSSRFLVPMIAGVLVALTGQLWLWSSAVMADTTGLALATAGVWAAARYARTRAARWLLLAAALLAYATITRWIYGLVSVPVTLYVLPPLFRAGSPKRVLLHAAGAALCVVVILAPVVVPALIAYFRQSEGVIPFGGNFQVYDWHPRNALLREFTTADGVLRFKVPTALYYVLAPARWSFFTVLLAPLLLPGVWAVLRRGAAAPLMLLIGWAGVVYLFHAGTAYQAMRFTLAFLPPLAILTAIGASVVARWTPRPKRAIPGFGRTGPALGTAGFLLALGIMAAGGVFTLRSLISIKNDGLATVAWTEARVPAEARLLTFNLTSTFRHYSRLDTHELWAQDSARLATLTASGPPLFLLVDLPSIERQWRDRSPGQNLRWLERGPGLTELGEHHGFTLFRVGPIPPRP